MPPIGYPSAITTRALPGSMPPEQPSPPIAGRSRPGKSRATTRLSRTWAEVNPTGSLTFSRCSSRRHCKPQVKDRAVPPRPGRVEIRSGFVRVRSGHPEDLQFPIYDLRVNHPSARKSKIANRKFKMPSVLLFNVKLHLLVRFVKLARLALRLELSDDLLERSSSPPGSSCLCSLSRAARRCRRVRS